MQQQRLRAGASIDLPVLLFKSRIVNLDAPVGRVSVGNPDIADIVVIHPTQLYVLGKDIGTTNVFFWDRDNILIGSVNVEVTHDLSSLKEKLHQLLPGQSDRGVLGAALDRAHGCGAGCRDDECGGATRRGLSRTGTDGQESGSVRAGVRSRSVTTRRLARSSTCCRSAARSR